MTAISPLSKQKFVVGLTSKSITYTDTTDWSSISDGEYVYVSSFKAILKLSGPNGVFYLNSGYNSGVFTSQDINILSTRNKVGIPNVPVDANGDILKGQYSFYVKYQINFGLIVAVNQGSKKFTITPAGNFATLISNLKDTDGVVFTVVGGANAGTYTVASVANGVSGTEVTVVESIPSATVAGAFYATIGEKANSINFDYDVPVAQAQMTHNCITSQLVCSDVTEYGSAGVVFVSRENRIKYPLTMETPVADIVNTDISVNQSVTVNPIYTKTWAGVITTNFTVDKTTYSLDITISGVVEHDVECDIRLCQAVECINTLIEQWKAYLGVNPTAAKKLETVISKLFAAYMLYSIYLECGNNEGACAQVDYIVELIGSTGCNCGCTSSEDTGYSQIILPLGSATAGAIPMSYLEIDNITTDDNTHVPTTKATKKFVGDNYVAKNYKEYMAIISQTSGNPTINHVIVNDFGDDVIGAASYIKGMIDGIYAVSALDGTPFTVGKTFAQITLGEVGSGAYACGIYQIDNANLQIQTKLNSSGTDGILTQAAIYIRVYN